MGKSGLAGVEAIGRWALKVDANFSEQFILAGQASWTESDQGKGSAGLNSM